MLICNCDTTNQNRNPHGKRNQCVKKDCCSPNTTTDRPPSRSCTCTKSSRPTPPRSDNMRFIARSCDGSSKTSDNARLNWPSAAACSMKASRSAGVIIVNDGMSSGLFTAKPFMYIVNNYSCHPFRLFCITLLNIANRRNGKSCFFT